MASTQLSTLDARLATTQTNLMESALESASPNHGSRQEGGPADARGVSPMMITTDNARPRCA
jgi:hypothetical protein